MYNLRQKIQEIIDNNYNNNEKRKGMGEVFTPFELIEEMLDKFPEDVWYNPDKTWLDPAAGLGNFHAVIVERLMEGLKEQIPDDNKRYKNIIEQQLYFIELNPESVRLIKKIFNPNNKYKMNIVCADSLDEDHHGWDDDGYMWDEEEKENRKLRKALVERKKVEKIKPKFLFD